MVLTLLVMFSPINPFPRVAADINTPFSYLRETDNPSIFNSQTYLGSIFSSLILLSNMIISSSLNTSAKDIIGMLCVTLSNLSNITPPIFVVGESSLFHSG